MTSLIRLHGFFVTDQYTACQLEVQFFTLSNISLTKLVETKLEKEGFKLLSQVYEATPSWKFDAERRFILLILLPASSSAFFTNKSTTIKTTCLSASLIGAANK